MGIAEKIADDWPAALAALTCAATLAQAKDIVDTAVSAGSFKTLATALQAAGLVDTLKGKGPFTVFAPTDEAFAKLGKDAIADLLKPENKAKLTSILTYHVVGGSVPAAAVTGMKSAKTVQGCDVAIVVKDGKQVTEFREGILPWALQRPVAICFDEYDAGRPDVHGSSPGNGYRQQLGSG